MFSIRVICTREEASTILADLGQTFTIKDTCQYPARTPGRVRLYVDADRAPAPRTSARVTTARRANAH
ncbi:hypothetical protein SMD44_01205 [Streptomyces alboflavus]|uniref:Uncharacterized protein n=1 Tax=Streptomyces alboflavus TaxID=67267 RepID=A0A1Z1W5X4_9ACTN|nr:hypothetical protein [Streptomyces alboflavus]ARX81807.1 hypothetical protein SMD44_01205 [Streptomyces alboflavus]